MYLLDTKMHSIKKNLSAKKRYFDSSVPATTITAFCILFVIPWCTPSNVVLPLYYGRSCTTLIQSLNLSLEIIVPTYFFNYFFSHILKIISMRVLVSISYFKTWLTPVHFFLFSEIFIWEPALIIKVILNFNFFGQIVSF